MGESGLSPLFTWRSVIASEQGPQDVELDLKDETGAVAGTAAVKGSTQRHVALTLSLHMSERGDSCFPPIAQLVKETGLGERTVQRAIQALRREGWLEVTQGGTWRGRKVASTYRAAWAPAYLESLETTGVMVTPVGRAAAVSVTGDGRQGDGGTGVRVTGDGRQGDGVGRKDLASRSSAGARARPRPQPPASHDPQRLERWIENLGFGYCDDEIAFRAELEQRFGIVGDPAERLRQECLAKLETTRGAAAVGAATSTQGGPESQIWSLADEFEADGL